MAQVSKVGRKNFTLSAWPAGEINVVFEIYLRVLLFMKLGIRVFDGKMVGFINYVNV